MISRRHRLHDCSRFTMDVQQLFTVLKKEAECPLCLDTVNNPKTLPCIHLFCLECILPRVSWQTRKFCKKKPSSDSQMPGLSDIFSNSWRRLVQEFACILSSQPIGGCSGSKRWRRTGPEMQQLWWEQHRFLLLFCLPNIPLYFLLWSSSAPEDHKRSSQCCNREIKWARCSRVDPQTRHVFTAISWKLAAGILLRRMQSSYLPEMLYSKP